MTTKESRTEALRCMATYRLQCSKSSIGFTTPTYVNGRDYHFTENENDNHSN